MKIFRMGLEGGKPGRERSACSPNGSSRARPPASSRRKRPSRCRRLRWQEAKSRRSSAFISSTIGAGRTGSATRWATVFRSCDRSSELSVRRALKAARLFDGAGAAGRRTARRISAARRASFATAGRCGKRISSRAKPTCRIRSPISSIIISNMRCSAVPAICTLIFRRRRS